MSAASAADFTTPERILQQLDWHVIRRLDGLLQGDYDTLFYGQGVDFTDLREYQAFDDIRTIDWNVTARMNALHVRQYVEERELTAWFLLDLSSSMAFGSDEYQKKRMLIEFVATLARVLTRSGNRVGAMLYDDGIEQMIAPAGGRRQVLWLIHYLLQRPIRRSGSLTDLSPLLNAALNAAKRRSLLFIISDFISVEGWERPLTMLSRRHELLAVRMYDRREVELPNVGPVYLEDAETGEQIYVDTSNRQLRQRFQQLAEQRVQRLQQTFKRAGVDCLSLSTEDDLIGSIVEFAALRKRLRRRRR